MNFKEIIQDYFTFSRNERKGIIILLIIIFVFAIANKTIFYFEKPAKIDTALLDSTSSELGLLSDSINRQPFQKRLFSFNPNTIDSVSLRCLDLPESVKMNLLKFRKKRGVFYSNTDFRKIYGVTDSIYNRMSPYLQFKNENHSLPEHSPKTELFVFDPNKASDDEFLRLGLSGKQVATIRNYQKKSGSFKNKEGFFRMWGLREDQKNVLSGYIVIEGADHFQTDAKSSIPISRIDLNTADSIQLKQLPGIGDKLSKRIVKYRDLLGGFYSVNQLREVYGLSEQTISLIADKVTIDITNIRKLDVNFSDVNELSRHPYLKKDLARQIVKFRSGYGSIHDLIVLRDSMILNIDDYTRLKPYF